MAPMQPLLRCYLTLHSIYDVFAPHCSHRCSSPSVCRSNRYRMNVHDALNDTSPGLYVCRSSVVCSMALCNRLKLTLILSCKLEKIWYQFPSVCVINERLKSTFACELAYIFVYEAGNFHWLCRPSEGYLLHIDDDDIRCSAIQSFDLQS